MATLIKSANERNEQKWVNLDLVTHINIEKKTVNKMGTNNGNNPSIDFFFSSNHRVEWTYSRLSEDEFYALQVDLHMLNVYLFKNKF